MIRPVRLQFPNAYFLDTYMAPRVRMLFTRLFLALSLISLFFFAIADFIDESRLPFRIANASPLLGLGLVLFAFFLIFFALEFFYRTNVEALGIVLAGGEEVFISTLLARVLTHMRFKLEPEVMFIDFWQALSRTDFLRVLLVRLGFFEEDFLAALFAGRTKGGIPTAEFFTELLRRADKASSREIALKHVLALLAERDEALKNFLFRQEIPKEIFVGAASWVEDEFDEYVRQQRWWLKENLSRIPGVGKDLGYGYTYNLDQYAREIEWSTTRFVREARAKEIEALERALARTNEANVLLVGEEGSGKHTIVEGLAEWIREGSVVPQLEHKRVLIFEGVGVEASAKSKGAYEEVMIRVLNEAVLAGNIILVIENFSSFIGSGEALGVDVVGILEPYISGPGMQMIALSDTASFHRALEPNGKLMKLFEKINIEEPPSERTLNMLEDAISTLEAVSGKIFTYQALVRAEELARRFITEGAMPEKAIDLLDEAAAAAPPTERLVFPKAIDAIVKTRTSIPTREAEGKEREALLKLEDALHERVVGQDRAIQVIADALRRARTGLRAGARPLGSFLLLGPTGVGKTETARALAEAYFGGVDSMVRFDMSEFQSADGVAKLIGAFDSNNPGVLASRLRERPFSLLLFDEFEKASRDVQNLFLQILDEGVFRDAYGRKVSARETMIIATSNAGANMIWDLIKEGKDPAAIQEKVVDGIRREGVLLPELLNRFDALVVFHPLSEEQLEKVALLILRDLARQLERQEIHFNPTRELARKIVEVGYDPTFGARPMRRAVQDRVEQLIARKILEGSLKRGDSFSFTAEDISRL